MVAESATGKTEAGSYAAKLLLAKWKRLTTKLGNLRKTRNKVAHGQLVTFEAGQRPFVRLTKPILNFGDDERALVMGGQKIGLGSYELKQAAAAVYRAGRQTLKFADCVTLLQVGDIATLLKRLADEADEKSGSPSPG